MPITITGNLLSRFLRSLTSLLRPAAHRPPSTQVLLIVEGPNDIEFLRRISTILHRDDPTLPDLAEMETQHALVFVPSGGVDLSSAFRFASLGLAEFHLSDQDIPPATQARQQVVAIFSRVNIALEQIQALRISYPFVRGIDCYHRSAFPMDGCSYGFP